MLLAAILIICVVLLVLVFIFLPGESTIGQRAPFWGVNHAHRGLHTPDKAVPENSLAAFTAAVDAGYGIELDIQLSKDGEVVVFHDDDLQRVCGVAGRVDAFTWEELKAFRLLDTEQRIPLLEEVLDLVGQRVPLIIELKTGPRNKQLCESAWRILRQYDGDFCIESFDPRIVGWFNRQVPGVLRGQLAAPPKDLGGGLLGFAVGYLVGNFLGRPQFIAYKAGKKPLVVRLAQRFAMRVVWTVRPGDDIAALEAENDAVIFEFYKPEPVYSELPGAPARFEEALAADEALAQEEAPPPEPDTEGTPENEEK